MPLTCCNLVLKGPPLAGRCSASCSLCREQEPLCAERFDMPLWWRLCAWYGYLYVVWLHLHAAVLLTSELFDGRDNRSCHYCEIKFLLSLSDMIFSFPLQLHILNIYYIPCRVTFTLERTRVKLLFFKQEKMCWNKSHYSTATTITHTHTKKEIQYENKLFLVKRAITLENWRLSWLAAVASSLFAHITVASKGLK